MKGKHLGKNNETFELYKAILKLKGLDECKRFFRDLCTLEEIIEISKRWQAVRLLAQDKSYLEIAKKTGLSTTTVARVAYWLYSGTGGHKLMLRRIKN